MTAVVRPILMGLLFGLKAPVVAEVGGHANVKLFMLNRLRRPGDGDTGICFEYAVHDALLRQDPRVADRIDAALTLCKVPRQTISSILFGAEKTGAISLINTSRDLLTKDSVLLYGTQGRPVKLRQHVGRLVEAFRKPDLATVLLPQSISGLWKADQFIGCQRTEKWIGTTLKINRADLRGAKGLRLGIVPARAGETDAIRKDDDRNLVICPLLYDYDFMQTFYESWEVAVEFLKADAQVPKEVDLPHPAARQVARFLASRRQFPVLEVIEALGPLAQPELLETQEKTAELIDTRAQRTETNTLLAPLPRESKR